MRAVPPSASVADMADEHAPKPLKTPPQEVRQEGDPGRAPRAGHTSHPENKRRNLVWGIAGLAVVAVALVLLMNAT